MARNGSGTYVVYTPGNPVVTGTTISSTAFNNTINDIATALTGSISADGQTPITANIPMNSHKLTGLGAPTVAGDALSYGGVVVGSTGAFTSGTFSTTLSATGHTTFEGVTSTGATGTGKLVYDNTPTLVTPVLGVATATSVTVSGVVGTSATDALVLPSGTTAQRGASTAGKIRYNSTTSSFEGYGTAWGSIGGGATGAGGDQVFQENQLIVTTNYTLSTGKSAMSKGPITINSGVVVTIPSGYSWLVL